MAIHSHPSLLGVEGQYPGPLLCNRPITKDTHTCLEDVCVTQGGHSKAQTDRPGLSAKLPAGAPATSCGRAVADALDAASSAATDPPCPPPAAAANGGVAPRDGAPGPGAGAAEPSRAGAFPPLTATADSTRPAAAACVEFCKT